MGSSKKCLQNSRSDNQECDTIRSETEKVYLGNVDTKISTYLSWVGWGERIRIFPYTKNLCFKILQDGIYNRMIYNSKCLINKCGLSDM